MRRQMSRAVKPESLDRSLFWTFENMSKELRVYGLLISTIFEFGLFESDKPGF